MSEYAKLNPTYEDLFEHDPMDIPYLNELREAMAATGEYVQGSNGKPARPAPERAFWAGEG